MPGVEIRAGTLDPERDGEVGATDAERAVGATDAERVSPRRDNGEAILGIYDVGEEVGDATRELGGDADDRDGLDKPA